MNNPLLVEGGGLLSPNVIKGKKTTTKSHSRYFHAVLYETGSLCKANNVKWGGDTVRNLTSRQSKHKGVDAVNDFSFSGTAHTEHTHTHTRPRTHETLPSHHTDADYARGLSHLGSCSRKRMRHNHCLSPISEENIHDDLNTLIHNLI